MYKEAVELSYKVWVWLFQNPDKQKEDSPYWEEIEGMVYDCPLCERFNNGCITMYKVCPLNFPGLCAGGAFLKWKVSPIGYKKAPAARIASILRRELRRLKEEENEG